MNVAASMNLAVCCENVSEMLALTSTAKATFLGIDNERFKSIMKISEGADGDAKKAEAAETGAKTLQLLSIKGFPRLLPEGILALVNYCRYIRELSLSYSLLSDELLFALSSEQQVQLETLRMEAHSETKPLPRLSEKAWFTFSSRLPHINLVLLSYMSNEEDYNPLLTVHVPLTHLYFGEAPSEATAARVARHCPRLVELVIAAYSFGTLDRILLSVAQGCPRLTALALGDCEVTCSGLLEFVAQCADRLKILYVWETALNEDKGFDVAELSTRVSLLLGRSWVPEYIPLW